MTLCFLKDISIYSEPTIFSCKNCVFLLPPPPTTDPTTLVICIPQLYTLAPIDAPNNLAAPYQAHNILAKGAVGHPPDHSYQLCATAQTPLPCHRVSIKPRCHARYRRAPVAPGFRLLPQASPSDRSGRAGELATASPAPCGLDAAGQPRRRRPLSRTYSTKPANQRTRSREGRD